MSEPTTRSGDLALAIYMGGIFITAVAMLLAVLLFNPRPLVIVVSSPEAAAVPQPGVAAAPGPGPALPGAPAAAPAPTTAAPADGAAAALPGVSEPPRPSGIQVSRVPAVPPAQDIFSATWDDAPALDVALLPQTLARPLLANATVSSVRIQAVHDDQRVAWRLSWEAPEPSFNVDADRFCDAVAIQFSLEPGTPFLMGGPGMPVRLLHWKALWQMDIDEHYQQVEDVHPNYRSDFYWFATGAFPSPYATSLDSTEARQFMPAMGAGNPVSDPGRIRPVEELVAEGMGTSTTVPETISDAHGVWHEGRWTVVFDRPLNADDPIASAMKTGQADAVAFAVWDGSAGNVGGQKHFSNWIPMALNP